ncbi:MAG: hypothetical protein IPF88_03575 [Candidatus Microthrix sp.]|nr:hypothetical protein [Candidatus Microthrix sp.]MBK6437691.1 hypothetical protein [Candidatus Microthrix sp.]
MSGGVQHGAVAPGEPITASRVTELLQGAGHDVVVEMITIEAVGTGQMGELPDRAWHCWGPG